MSLDTVSSFYAKFAEQQKHDPSQMAFRVPVAIRKQQYGGKRWTSIMATRDERGHDGSSYFHTHFRQHQRITWSSIKFKILRTQEQLWWNAVLILSVTFNFFFLTGIVFSGKAPSLLLLYGCLLCNFIFLFNWILSVTIYHWKEMQKRFGIISKSAFQIWFDAFLCMSFVFTLACIIEVIVEKNQFSENNILWLMNYIGTIQLYYLPLYFMEQANDIGVNRWIILLVPYILYLSIFIHAVACILFVIGLKEQQNNNKYWLETLEQYRENENPSASDMYFYSLHFSVILVTCLGLGDVTPITISELMVASLVMMIGFFLTVLYFIGSLSSLMVNSEEREALYRADLLTIRDHLKAVHCNEVVQTTIVRYYTELWMNKKGIKKTEHLILLPIPLRMELCYDLCVGPFQTSVLFRLLPEPFLRKLSMSMKPKFYLPGDTINYQHVAKYMMIIVTSGVIHILSDEDNESPIISLGFGTCIGEIAMVYTLPSKSSVRAATYVEVQTLRKLDFFRFVKSYPDIHKKIRQNIEQRIEIAQRKDEFRPKRENIFNLFVTKKTEMTAIMQIKEILSKRPDFKSQETEYNNKVALKYIVGLYNIHRGKAVIPDKDLICIPSSSYPFIINPRSKLDALWRYIVFYTILIMSIIYPYYLAFDRTYPHWFSICCILGDIIFYIDIYVSLTTAIVHKNKEITTFKEIYNYRLNRLPIYLDVLAVLPIEHFSILMIPNSQDLQIYYYFKLNRFIKIWKMWKFFTDKERNLLGRIRILRLCKYILFMLLLSYWMGVVLYIEACFSTNCRETSWFVQQQKKEVAEHIIHPFTNQKEIMSIYFGFSTVSGAGYGDIYPTDIIDTIVVWTSKVLGTILFGYCIAELSVLITFQLVAQTTFKEIFSMLLKCISQSNMTHNIKKRLLGCYEMQWYYNGGFFVVQKHELLHKATEEMRQDVLEAERKKTLRKVPLFNSTNDDFIATIASGSRMQILPPEEYVIYSGDVNRQMYIIHKGYCQVIEDGIPVKTLSPGSHFGIECLLYGIPSILTIRSFTHCKILSISSYIFIKATDMFPLYLEHETISMNDIIAKTFKASPETPHEVVTKPKFRLHSRKKLIQQIVAQSFVNVKKYCDVHQEIYNQPFQNSNMRFLKFLFIPYCLLPEGMILKGWYFIRISAALAVAMFLPFDITISPYKVKYVSNVLLTTYIIAYCDLYVMMFVGYYGKHGQLIIHPLKTCKRYVTALFILDLFLCIPFNRIIYAIMMRNTDKHHEEFEWWLNVIRLIRIGQAYRIHTAITYLQKNILHARRIYAIIEFLLVTLIVSNFWCCLYIVTTCKPFLNSEGVVHMTCMEQSWHHRSVFANQTSALEVYITSFYWASSQMIGFGFGDITPQFGVNVVLCILNILAGQLIIGYVYAYISSSIATQHRTLASFQQEITEIVKFMVRKGVTPLLRKRIQKYFEHRWKRTGGIEPFHLLSVVHTTLTEDAAQKLYEQTLRVVPLFASVEKSFFRILAPHLKDRYYIRGEIIIRRNDVIHNIFILHRGKIEITNEHNEIVSVIGPGALFGNINVVTLKPCTVTISALQNLDILIIDCEIFYNILKDYPDILHKIEKELTKDVNYIIPTATPDEELLEQENNNESMKSDLSQQSIKDIGTIITLESIPRWTEVLNPRRWFRVALIPDSSIFHVYSIIVLISSYANMILITYQFFFDDISPVLIFPSICIDIVFIIKVLLECQKSYVNKFGEYVLDLKQIHRRYVSNYKDRLIDFVANLPLCYIALPIPDPIGGTTFVCLRLIHAFRLIYIVEFYNEHSKMLSIASFYLKLSWLFVWFTLLMHFFACFWFYVPCIGARCIEGFWGEERGLTKQRNPFENYLHSLYHMTNIMTMTGQGDIYPKILLELIMSIMLIVSTKIFVGVLIGEITCVQNLYSSEQVSYSRTVMELKDYMTNNHLTKYQQRKMWNYVRQLWIRDRGKQMPILCKDLPYSMKCDLMFDMYGEHIKNSYVFEKCSADFVRQICALLNRYIFYPSNYVVQGGDTDNCMYFIHLGEIEVLTVHQDLTETIHDVLRNSDTFGVVQGLYNGVPHYFSFRAKSEVEIVYLCLNDWKHLHNVFPNVVRSIYERAAHVLL